MFYFDTGNLYTFLWSCIRVRSHSRVRVRVCVRVRVHSRDCDRVCFRIHVRAQVRSCRVEVVFTFAFKFLLVFVFVVVYGFAFMFASVRVCSRFPLRLRARQSLYGSERGWRVCVRVFIFVLVWCFCLILTLSQI